MAFAPLIIAFLLALTSLICSVYFNQHVEDRVDAPLYITWITLSAAITYVLLCFIIIHCIRRYEQQHPQVCFEMQQPPKSVESPHFRISRASIDSDTTIEAPVANQHDSLSTFYYCQSSFAAIHLNSAMNTPRTPETVIHRPHLRQNLSLLSSPPRASYMTPSPKLHTASKLNMASVKAIKVDVPSTPATVKTRESVRRMTLREILAGEEKKTNDFLRKDSVSRIMEATARRSGRTQATA